MDITRELGEVIEVTNVSNGLLNAVNSTSLLDSSQTYATTAFVKGAGELFSKITQVSSNATLTTSSLGSLVNITTTGVVATLPLASTCPAGSSVTFVYLQATGTSSISAAGADTLLYGGGSSGASVSLPPGFGIQLVSDGVSSWISANQTLPVSFATLLAGNNTWTGTNTFNNTVSLSGSAINETQASSISGASTTNLGGVAGNYVFVGGAATTINSFGTAPAGIERTVFWNVTGTTLVLSGSLGLPGGANIVTTLGDTAIFRSEGGGNWRCISYQRINGLSPKAVFSASFLSGPLTYAALGGSITTVAHGLSQRPNFATACARCITAEGNYVAGDEISLPGIYEAWGGSTNSASGTTLQWDATNIRLIVPVGISQFAVANKDGSGVVTLTPANWSFYFRAWY